MSGTKMMETSSFTCPRCKGAGHHGIYQSRQFVCRLCEGAGVLQKQACVDCHDTGWRLTTRMIGEMLTLGREKCPCKATEDASMPPCETIWGVTQY